MDYKVLLGLFLGIVAYSLLYLAKGIEKLAIEGIKEVRTLKSKNSGIWIFGVILNAAYMFIQWAALKLAPINLIAPLNGFGLVVLLIFSYFILKERISAIEVLGALLIMSGTVAVSIFSSNYGIITSSSFNTEKYIFFTLAVLSGELIIVFLSRLKRLRVTGIIAGLTAGTFFAFETASKRITAIPGDNIKLIFTIFTMFIAFVGFVFTQYALVKEKANLAVPCFTATSVVFATVVGSVFLNEDSDIYSILAIGVIVLGTILLTAFKGKKIPGIKFSLQE